MLYRLTEFLKYFAIGAAAVALVFIGYWETVRGQSFNHLQTSKINQMASLNFCYTCPDINKARNAFDREADYILKRFADSIIEGDNPEDIHAEALKEILKAYDEFSEEVRDLNSDLRKSAEAQLDEREAACLDAMDRQRVTLEEVAEAQNLVNAQEIEMLEEENARLKHELSQARGGRLRN